VEISSQCCCNGVFFNIGTPHAIPNLMKSTMNSNAPAAQIDKPLILVVDDEPDTRQIIVGALTGGGFSCATATSVGEAISALNNDRFKLMVLDWGLDRCGSEVLHLAKRLYPQMPVLVMSGLPFDVRTDAIMEEADAFLPKPFSNIVLNKQAAQLIARDTFLPKRPEDILPLEEVKRVYIQHVVALLDNNASLAAEKLHIHRQTVSAALQQTDANTDGPPGIKRTN
jgi:DNA-binding NtrC family response regulator